VPRPENIPKTEIRQTYDRITGWEEQLIPANFHFLVKNGVNEHVINDTTDPAPRSLLGIREDGTILLVMNEGRQEKYSRGYNCYEMAEFMIALGCVQAINCDGGGSSVFLSQRPGEEIALHCNSSEGAERPTTHEILVISRALTGDVNGDGAVTPEDVVRFNDYFAGKNAEIWTLNADVCKDGIVNRKDAMFLARSVAQWQGYSLNTLAGE